MFSSAHIKLLGITFHVLTHHVNDYCSVLSTLYGSCFIWQVIKMITWRSGQVTDTEAS